MRRPALRTAGLLLALGLLAACGKAPTMAAASVGGWHGDEPDNVVSRPSFTLTDTHGATYDFGKETGGAPTLLYFGYTDCPDECPTAMADISRALTDTTDELRAKVKVVFVTTAPDRDSPARLASWLGKYNKDFIGLTGTADQVKAAQVAAGAPLAYDAGPAETLPGQPNAHVHLPGSPPHTHDRPLGERVAHDTSIFAYDASDRLPVLYPETVSPSDIRADLPALARKE